MLLAAAFALPDAVSAQKIFNIPSTELPCMAAISLTPVAGRPNRAVLRVQGQQTPFAGDVTVDGDGMTWHGHIEHGSTTTVIRYPQGFTYALNADPVFYKASVKESSVLFEAPGPIRGAAFAPVGGDCTMHAAIGPPGNVVARVPSVTVGAGTTLALPPCKRPYATAAITYTAMPPQEGSSVEDRPSHAPLGQFVLGVALDARGNPSAITVVRLPNVFQRSEGYDAVRKSSYSPAVWRCARVADGTLYSI